MTDFDRENIDMILRGYGCWFSAYLLRAIKLASKEDRALFFISYPEYVKAIYEASVLDGESNEDFKDMLELLWMKADAGNKTKLRRCFVEFNKRGHE